MTVKELIAKLQVLPQEMDVKVFDNEYGDYDTLETVKIISDAKRTISINPDKEEPIAPFVGLSTYVPLH